MGDRDLARNELDEGSRNLDVVEREPGTAQLIGDDLRELPRRNEVTLREEIAEPPAFCLLDFEHLRERALGEHTGSNEELTEGRWAIHRRSTGYGARILASLCRECTANLPW